MYTNTSHCHSGAVCTNGVEDKVTERKVFSYVKVPEPFKMGDIVKLKHLEQYSKADDISGSGLNLYKIASMRNDTVMLESVD